MKWPIVTVLICTYNRAAELIKTLTALRDHLHYEGEIQYTICDDNSSPAVLKKIKAAAIFKELKPLLITTKTGDNSGPMGWAVNVNNGLRSVSTDYTFFLEDDYVLTSDINLSAAIALLEEKPLIGLLRYRATAGDHVVFHQFEANISGALPDYQEGHGLPGRMTYLQLDSGSPSLYLYSNGPHLKHKRFHEFYGGYPIGLKLGQTEETYAHIVKDGMKREGAPGIAILPGFVSMQFDHIGQSYQHTEADK